jgi:hypothetical protein
MFGIGSEDVVELCLLVQHFVQRMTCAFAFLPIFLLVRSSVQNLFVCYDNYEFHVSKWVTTGEEIPTERSMQASSIFGKRWRNVQGL